MSLSLIPTMTAILWPEKYLPGTTHNYISNEVIVSHLSAAQVWPLLVDISKWESYYPKVSQITPPSHGPLLEKGDKFSFATLGFPPLQAEVLESVPPTAGKPGKLGWRAWQAEGDVEKALDVYHAWIVEDLDRGRVRILTQESQIGKPAAKMALEKPNVMLNGHQDWLDGLVEAARKSAKLKEWYKSDYGPAFERIGLQLAKFLSQEQEFFQQPNFVAKEEYRNAYDRVHQAMVFAVYRTMEEADVPCPQLSPPYLASMGSAPDDTIRYHDQEQPRRQKYNGG
ncbi:hypothetical protein QFC22_006578 [Naganishia vaughanmartiniae]|uniref:Uncharacterized protein n=1 Tax=Naganishia vaughanmartiniae TaxID=1424756 RepID=A0ACC2WHI0_9TREE|nr:hypothetical protein QFC22_006578 [Naganishia vaughanmartiniae]